MEGAVILWVSSYKSCLVKGCPVMGGGGGQYRFTALERPFNKPYNNKHCTAMHCHCHML